jgi:hypothetical protein
MAGRGPIDDVPRTADWFVLDRVFRGTRCSSAHQGSRLRAAELLVDDVDDGDLPAWEAVLVGVAHVLLERLGAVEHDELVLEPVVRVTVAHIAQGYAEPFDPADSDRTTRHRPAPGRAELRNGATPAATRPAGRTGSPVAAPVRLAGRVAGRHGSQAFVHGE